ncbi:MAG TPA: MBL fold metallo-hydrolase [Desulfitobacteriaceae bacterium]|nr:MBL fold metallo-hydrolase [Desulfitobacteriaceae bacterium]
MNDALLVSPFEIPTIFSIGPINVYIINAEPLTLIDTGLQNDKAETALKAGLHSLGYSMKDIQRIFITHGDYDHSGLAVKISEASGASIYVHEMEKLKMDGWNNYISRKADVLRAGGLPDRVFDEVVNSTQNRVGIAQPLNEYIPLSGGEVFPFEGFDLEVFYTPGHALGHLCFFLRKQGFLFAGDTLLAHVTPNPQLEIDETAQDGRFKSLKQYMDSLDLLEKLPVKKVFTGHGRPVANIKKRIAEIREHHSRRAKRIARALAAKAKPMSPYQLALELYKVLDGYNNVLGVSEIWGHLDILQEAGVIEGWTERGGHLFKTNSIK